MALLDKYASDNVYSRFDGCFHADIPRFVHQLRRAKSDKDRTRIDEKIAESKRFCQWRRDNAPVPRYPQELPVCLRRLDIAKAISDNQVVIIAGSTGSGKTTQLPKICLELGRGVNGLIGCTQPRRVAAINVAERVAEELETTLGDAVGYQVRFEQRSKRETFIKFMTDGVLLSQTRGDPDLLAYDTLIIDEAHERSLNIDFILGYVKRLIVSRPDLKIIISSATLEVERFSEYFNGAPVIEVEGRTFPVDLVYSPLAEDESDFPVIIGHSIEALFRDYGPGDTLVFMTGEQDVRETVSHLEKRNLGGAEVLPLYSRLTPSEQRLVFHPGDRRRIVVSTNVAETSVTVPRIRYVVDSGLARIKRYNPRTQVERLQVEAISQASANQRSGRCGRVQAGICVRLFAEDEFLRREEYTDPEIKRSSLAGVILQMSLLRLGRVEDFPFIEPPSSALVRSGYDELDEIGAIDDQRLITTEGKAIAALPIEPRYGRMLLEAYRTGCLEEAIIIVAALSVQDPRLRPLEKRDEADKLHGRYLDRFSDFKSWIHLWRELQKQREILGSNNRYNKWCRDNMLSYLRLREWQNTVNQLTEMLQRTRLPKSKVVARNFIRPKVNKRTGLDDPQLHKSLLSGLLSRCGVFHEEDKEYRGSREMTFHLWPGSGLVSTRQKWVMAAEIVETARPFARTVAAIDPQWLEEVGGHLLKRSFSDPFFDEKSGCVRAYMNCTLYGLPVVERRRVHYAPYNPHKSREVFILDGLVRRKLITKLPFYFKNNQLLKKIEDGQDKLRRKDLLLDEQGIFDFYDSRLPADIYTLRNLEKFCQREKSATALFMGEEDIALETANGLSRALFPEALNVNGHKLALHYRFDPGDSEDGVTATLPLGLLQVLSEDIFDWLVPGFFPQKVSELLRSLPRSLRRELNPVEQIVERVLENVSFGKGNLYNCLSEFINRQYCLRSTAADFKPGKLPPFLRMNFVVIDSRGNTVSTGRDFTALRHECAGDVSANFKQAPKDKFERSGICKWDFNLPPTISLPGGATGFPGIKDEATSVSLYVYELPELASRISRKGICRLAIIALEPQIAKIRRSFSVSNNALMYYAAIGGGADSFSQECIEASVLTLFDQLAEQPRSCQEFTAFLDSLRSKLYSLAVTTSAVASRSLEQSAALRGLLLPERSELKNSSISEMDAQLSRLIYPGFIRDAGTVNILNIPRYLNAIELRLQRLHTSLNKDRKRAAEINPLWQQTLEMFVKARKNNLVISELSEYRWLLEEYAVSLFAQEIGAGVKVSSERLSDLWRIVENKFNH